MIVLKKINLIRGSDVVLVHMPLQSKIAFN